MQIGIFKSCNYINVVFNSSNYKYNLLIEKIGFKY